MIFQVWHKNDPTFMDNIERTLVEFPAGFTHVANVDTYHEGRVFEFTNHIDRAWWDNPQVEKVVNGQARSTSVGDVIVNTHTNTLWTIDGIGLREFKKRKDL